MDNQEDFEDFTQEEVNVIFLKACERGRIDFMDFYLKNPELKYRAVLKGNCEGNFWGKTVGEEAIDLSISSNQFKSVEYLLFNPEVLKQCPFDFDFGLMRIMVLENGHILEKILKKSYEENQSINFVKHFMFACEHTSQHVVNKFIKATYLHDILTPEVIIDGFYKAVKTENHQVVDFFLNQQELNFSINLSFYLNSKKEFAKPRIILPKSSKNIMGVYKLNHDLTLNYEKRDEKDKVQTSKTKKI